MANKRQFATTYGIELTYIAPKQEIKKWLRTVDYPRPTYYFANRMEKGGVPYFGEIHMDGDALEVNTPPFKSEKEMEDWYFKFYSILADTPFEATWDAWYTNGEWWIGSGGGHIHCGLPFKDILRNAQFVRKVMRFILDRPWLNWVFNEWCDTENANSLNRIEPRDYEQITRAIQRERREGDGINTYTLIWAFVVFGMPIKTNTEAEIFLMNAGIGKQFATSFKERTQTLELRFFDAPKNYQQLVEHVRFVDAMVRYCKEKLVKSGGRISKDTDRDSVDYELRNTCRLLNLNYETYKKYLINYDKRVENGVELT